MYRKSFLLMLFLSLSLVFSCNLGKKVPNKPGDGGKEKPKPNPNPGPEPGPDPNPEPGPDPNPEPGPDPEPEPGEEDDYEKDSPLYKKHITGLAYAKDRHRLYASVEDGILYEKNLEENTWSQVNINLGSYTKVFGMVELAGGTSGYAIAVLTNEARDKVGVFRLQYYDGKLDHTPMLELDQQRALSLIKTVGSDQKFHKAYLCTELVLNGDRSVYDLCSSSEVPLKNEEGQNPSKEYTVLGCGPYGDVFLLNKSSKDSSGIIVEAYELWGPRVNNKPKLFKSKKPLSLLGVIPLKDQAAVDVVVSENGDMWPINFDNATINYQAGIEGLGDKKIDPNFLSWVGETPVLATYHGYYEVGKAQISTPTDLTTDLTSYTKNHLNVSNIKGIYSLRDGRVYMATKKRGLWVRDPQTKKWKGV